MRILGTVLLLGLALMSQGCAIFVRGDLQDVTVQSQVPDVRVEIDGKVAALGSVELDRNRIHVLRAEAPGYDPLEVTIYPSINDDWLFAEQCTMWPILWLPMAVDYNSGALNDLPSPIDLQLTKTKEAPPTTAGSPSTVQAVAEVKHLKLVGKKPEDRRESIHDYRTARMACDDGF